MSKSRLYEYGPTEAYTEYKPEAVLVPLLPLKGWRASEELPKKGVWHENTVYVFMHKRDAQAFAKEAGQRFQRAFKVYPVEAREVVAAGNLEAGVPGATVFLCKETRR